LNKSYKKAFMKGSLPIFILAGVVLFLALALELLRLTMYADSGTHIVKAQMEKKRNIDDGESVFAQIHKQYPTYKEALESLVQYDVKFQKHNYVLGDYKSKVQVVLFNDNDCAVCRQEQERLLRILTPYQDRVVIVFKHMPSVRGEESLSSMFGQIAVREGVYEPFIQGLSEADKTFETPEDYFNLLNNLGVSLSKLRGIMTHDMTNILTEIQSDVDMAVDAGAYNAKSLPVVYINGYRLGSDYLPQHKMEVYLDRLIDGKTIIPKEGFEE